MRCGFRNGRNGSALGEGEPFTQQLQPALPDQQRERLATLGIDWAR
ncbi:hypothetical protein [Streptomyces sp. NPDC058279]